MDVSHLNGAPLPGRKYLLNPLAKKAMPLGDPFATPSEEKVELYGLSLYIGPVVFLEGWHLGRETHPILADLLPQLIQAKLLDLLLGGRTWKAVEGR